MPRMGIKNRWNVRVNKVLVAHGRFAFLCKTDSILTDIEFLMECIILATYPYRIQLCNLKEKLAHFANRFTCPVIEDRNVNSTEREMDLGLPHIKWL